MKQMHGYSDGRTRSGGTVRGPERGDLQPLNDPLSYWRPPYRGRDAEETSFHPPSTHLSGSLGFEHQDRQNLLGLKINCSHKGMIPMHNLLLLSHFVPIQLAR